MNIRKAPSLIQEHVGKPTVIIEQEILQARQE